MEQQHESLLSISDRGRSLIEGDGSFLRFTHWLNECDNAENLLRDLPFALRNLISARTFLVVHDYGLPLPSGAFVDGEGWKPLEACELLPEKLSAYFWADGHSWPLVIPSIANETRFPDAPDAMDWFRSNGDRSVCMVPLSTKARRLGLIGVGRSFEDAFSEEEVSLLETAAHCISLALDAQLNFVASETARVALENERTKLRLILDLNNSVASNLELKDVIRAISPNIRDVMQLDAVALILPTGSSGAPEVYALDFPDGKGYIRPGTGVAKDGLAAQVFRSGKPWVGDIRWDSQKHLGRELALQEGLTALCLLPLVRSEQVLGVLAVGRLRKHSFTQQDVDFMVQIAGQLAIAMDNALSYRKISELSHKLAQEKLYLENEIRSELNFEEIVGNSAVLRRVLRQVEAVAPTNSTALIYGETGSGKELIARAVHKLSGRCRHPFVKLNCAAIPTGLLESELFGHEKGAFTGAIAQRIGRFELASDGTIFLDEVGEIPLELQPKLLRVLQEREFERLGSSRTLHTDARLVAATNRDLNAMVESQKFRSDLFYRLNVFPIYVPPLRERPEDIPFLIRHFVRHFGRLMQKPIETISSETMEALLRYPWPGNIRELQNVIERAVILSPGHALRVAMSDLKPRVTENSGTNGGGTLEEMERRHILAVLEQTNWVFAGPHGAAARLGLKRPTLQFRMRKLGIARPDRR
ncbi:sigma 54-interacting transcriptional regulator [Acidicapsa acidisoli]|uniref:sigma 54-interacting transcriptional regulator n=1 Tax=Acidicapsa acidisoli TaxID=1615681 RepID=UPI0021E095CE|nr:sigma 54-interacting transcriptional regulator [Acidicapsa acidisoli]